MASELGIFPVWTFTKICPIPEELNNLLVEGEVGVCAFKTIRDISVFTNKRIILRDAQGLTGKKIEMYTIPYKSIEMYSTENAGTLDLNSEVQIWTKTGEIKIKLKKDIDIRVIDKLLADSIL